MPEYYHENEGRKKYAKQKIILKNKNHLSYCASTIGLVVFCLFSAFFVNDNYMATKNLLMKNFKNQALIDLQNVIIDETLPKNERIESLLSQANPYKFAVDEITVNVNFIGTETLEQKLKNLLI